MSIDFQNLKPVKEVVVDHFTRPAGGINCPLCWCDLQWLTIDTDNPYDDVIAMCPKCKHVIVIRVWQIKQEIDVKYLTDRETKEMLALLHTENPFPSVTEMIEKMSNNTDLEER